MTGLTTHIERLTVHLQNLGAPFLILLIAASALYSVWYYSSTVPPARGFIKRLLISLRTAAIVLLIVGFAEPVVKIVKTVTRKSTAVILLDTSSSMDQPGDQGRKRDALDVVNTIRSRSAERCVFRVFDSTVRESSGEITFKGAGTDIFNAVKSISSMDNISSVIVVSDGRWNLGLDPSSSGFLADIPVNCVAVGSKTGEADVVLARVSAPSIGYEGDSVPVELFVTSSVPLSDPVRVEIREGEHVTASGTVSLKRGAMARVELNLPLNTPGKHTFNAVVISGLDEPQENNLRSFVIRVVKSAFRILVIADAPSPDLAFMRRAIESDDAFEGVFAVGSGLSEQVVDSFPGDLTRFDCFVVLEGGGSIITAERARTLSRLVSEGCGLWIAGSGLFPENAEALGRILPVRFAKSRKDSSAGFFMELTGQGRSHFITAGSADAGREGNWKDLPPLDSIAPIDAVTRSGTILVNAVSSNRAETLPALIAGRHGDGRIVVMPVSGIWRWHLMMEGAGRSRDFYRGFVLGTLRWLTSGVETSPLTVTTDSQTYLSGQEILFEARLYDNVYSPVSGAEISLVIDREPSSKVLLEERAQSVYTGVFRGTAPGDHVYTAQAYAGGDLFAESSGKFSVDEFSLEMLDTSPDHDLLGILAAKTGGVSVSPAGIDSILAVIKPSVMRERIEENHSIALNPFLPFAAVLLFALEWGIRKYRGMI